MAIELLNSGLNILHNQGLASQAFHAYFARAKRDLLDDDIVAVALVVAVGKFDDDSEAATMLFSLLLDEARMGIENDSAYAQVFLTNVERAIEVGLASGTLEAHHLLKFAGQYRRVGLRVPDLLIINPDKVTVTDETLPPDLEDYLKKLAAEAQAGGGGSYELFNALLEMTAAIPENMQAGFANHLSGLSIPMLERCALYWLLAGTPLIQEAAAAGLYEKLKCSTLLSDTLFYLPIVRGWLPAGTARELVDELNKSARRRGHSSAIDQQKTSAIQDITASIPDGVGAQNIMIVVKRHKKTFVAMLLTKTGYGIKDAFVIPCRSKREAQDIVMRARHEANAAHINRATAELFLEAALADGIENGCMPAPGIIDVMAICDLHGLRPQKRSLQDLLTFVDPERGIQDATLIKFNRILNHEAALDTLIPVTESWFEDTVETRDILRSSRLVRNIEAKIWKYVEGRRELWARRFLQTAIMLKDAKMEREARTLAASAFALMDARPLRKIPLMEDIVFTTLEAGGAPIIW